MKKYYEKVKEITRESDKVLNNFFTVVSSRLDKKIEEVNKNDLNECLKYAGYFHLTRFLVLLSVAE
jgi:hypothetical protein